MDIDNSIKRTKRILVSLKIVLFDSIARVVCLYIEDSVRECWERVLVVPQGVALPELEQRTFSACGDVERRRRHWRFVSDALDRAACRGRWMFPSDRHRRYSGPKGEEWNWEFDRRRPLKTTIAWLDDGKPTTSRRLQVRPCPAKPGSAAGSPLVMENPVRCKYTHT